MTRTVASKRGTAAGVALAGADVTHTMGPDEVGKLMRAVAAGDPASCDVGLKRICLTGGDQALAAVVSGARGYALDQQLSGGKAKRELSWVPRHLNQRTK